jgi:DNA-binding MarR family transcriptional regulator
MQRKGPEGSSLLEVVLQIHGDLRKTLSPIHVTPLQAGVLLFLSDHAKTTLTDTAATLRVSLPTMSEVVKDLVRKRWVTKRRSVTESRAVQLELSRQGHMLARHIDQRVCQVEATLMGPNRNALSMHLEGHA